MKRERRKIVRTTTWSAGPGCHGGCGVLAHIEELAKEMTKKPRMVLWVPRS